MLSQSFGSTDRKRRGSEASHRGPLWVKGICKIGLVDETSDFNLVGVGSRQKKKPSNLKDKVKE